VELLHSSWYASGRRPIVAWPILLLACVSAESKDAPSKNCPELTESISVSPSISCALATRAVYFLLVKSHHAPIPLTSIKGELSALELIDVRSVSATQNCGAVVHVAQQPDPVVEIHICISRPCAGRECALSIWHDSISVL
jgi:hypothetical protein